MEKINIKKGIRFECQGSSNCCVSRGSYGFVYLSNRDILKLTKHFNKKKIDFIKKYCSKTEKLIHLKELKKNKGNCIFLKNNKCTVYKNRPTQCRTWPFWNENMNTKKWNKDISKNCPGIGKGKLFSYKKIKNILDQDYQNEKSKIELKN